MEEAWIARLKCAPVERVEQREFSRTRKRRRAYRDPGDDQLSENHDDSSDIDSDDFAVEEDGANRDMQNDELGFLFASRRTQSGRIVKTRLFFGRNFSKCNGG